MRLLIIFRNNMIKSEGAKTAVLHFYIKLIIIPALSGLFHQFPRDGLFFPVKDCRGLFVVFPFFKFPDDAFFFNKPLKTFDCFFQHFVIIYDDMSQMNSPPSGIYSWRGFSTPPFRAFFLCINPRPIPYENNIPRPFRARLLIKVCIR